MRQLSFGWLVYSDDNSGLLVNNSGTVDTRAYRQSWVNNIEDWGTSVENTNPAYVFSGKLAPYVNNNLSVYKCPCDQSVAQDGPRLRSISMNSLVGNPLISPNRFNPTWFQFLKLVQMPHPDSIYVFIEEHPDTINDGYFMNVWDQIKSGNLPPPITTGPPTCPGRMAIWNVIVGFPTRCDLQSREASAGGSCLPHPPIIFGSETGPALRSIERRHSGQVVVVEDSVVGAEDSVPSPL